MSASFPVMLLLFSLIVFLSQTLEGITGFGSTALSLPFVTLMLSIEVARPVLMLYTLLLCLYILPPSLRQIDWKHYGIMLGLMALGLPLGMLLYTRLPRVLLLGLLAFFMIAVALRGLWQAFNTQKKEKPMPGWLLALLTFLGGIIHGAFSSGGPLVIIYATEKIKDKSRFRATMCMIWFTLNVLLLGQMAVTGAIPAAVWQTSLWGLPALLAGTVLGDIAHKKLEAGLFTKITYAVLLLSGVFMAVSL